MNSASEVLSLPGALAEPAADDHEARLVARVVLDAALEHLAAVELGGERRAERRDARARDRRLHRLGVRVRGHDGPAGQVPLEPAAALPARLRVRDDRGDVGQRRARRGDERRSGCRARARAGSRAGCRTPARRASPGPSPRSSSRSARRPRRPGRARPPRRPRRCSCTRPARGPSMPSESSASSRERARGTEERVAAHASASLPVGLVARANRMLALGRAHAVLARRSWRGRARRRPRAAATPCRPRAAG